MRMQVHTLLQIGKQMIHNHQNTCTYKPPQQKEAQEIKGFWEGLEEITNKLQGRHLKILIGYFNTIR